jgi:prevent-host-death family protein
MGEKSETHRVGVRELRQNLSVYLRRVKESGETLEVTEHGHAVARLGPLPAATLSPYERMLAEGRIRPAAGDLLGLEPLELAPGISLTDMLLSMREEETR